MTVNWARCRFLLNAVGRSLLLVASCAYSSALAHDTSRGGVTTVQETAFKDDVRVEYLMEDRTVPVGSETKLRFKVVDGASGEPRSDISDISVLATFSAGTWHMRLSAEPLGDGVYEATVSLPQAGRYFVYLASGELGRRYNQLPYVMLHARDVKSANTSEGG